MVMPKLPGFIHIPRWRKRASGLIVPSSVADLAVSPEAMMQPPAELMPKPAPIAVTGRAPADLDQMCAYVDESALKLRVSTAASLRKDLARVPFEPAMQLVAFIAAKVFACRRNLEAQLELAKWLYGDDDLLRRIREFIAETENPVVFAEQNCIVLERLLIESATDAGIEVERTDHDYKMIVASLIGAASISGQVEEKARAAAVTPQDFLALFIQNGAYNSRRAPIVEIQGYRAFRASRDSGRSPGGRRRHQRLGCRGHRVHNQRAADAGVRALGDHPLLGRRSAL
jgi:hypothetical protein